MLSLFVSQSLLFSLYLPLIINSLPLPCETQQLFTYSDGKREFGLINKCTTSATSGSLKESLTALHFCLFLEGADAYAAQNPKEWQSSRKRSARHHMSETKAHPSAASLTRLPSPGSRSEAWQAASSSQVVDVPHAVGHGYKIRRLALNV